jgi:hypothetical protein
VCVHSACMLGEHVGKVTLLSLGNGTRKVSLPSPLSRPADTPNLPFGRCLPVQV